MNRKYFIIDGRQVCNKCNENKLVNEFATSEYQITGYLPTCKICYNKNYQAYLTKKREINHDEMKRKEREYRKKLHKGHPESYEIRKNNGKKWREEHKEETREYQIKWNAEHIEHRRRINKKWRDKNREHYRNHRNKREKELNKTNPQYKLRRVLRSRLRNAIKEMGGIKPCGTEELYGCSPVELVKHIESQWLPNMSWANHGRDDFSWNIDHIKSLSEFDLTKEDEVRKACNYTNLRPLWAKDNSIKSVEDRKNSIHKDSWIK
jgi:hypothetical protein